MQQQPEFSQEFLRNRDRAIEEAHRRAVVERDALQLQVNDLKDALARESLKNLELEKEVAHLKKELAAYKRVTQQFVATKVILANAEEPTPDRCESCRFCSHKGECVRFPPVPNVGWARVAPECWCGEYEAKG